MSRHRDAADSARSTTVSSAEENIDRLVRWADDFPVAGVRFADLTPVFADAEGLSSIIDALAVSGEGADLVAGIDARGFLLGAGVALALGSGVLAVRKAGKLPPPVVSRRYELEYGAAELEIPEAIDVSGRRILVVDDVLATGGTIAATVALLRSRGAEVVGAAVVLEIAALGGRAKFDGYPLTYLKQV
ncbi:adenine phosphoribosyltransferase [Rhodococcoides yunnanense]|uniref:adenine phosphoribosyltransferase n=1 Tax=Rhodococcoides yunnanense TaxID=278209 RepID=UPI00093339EC|nr:adenine phosphoribosyltransferase [Rhodococcus yunnanensis]